MSEPLAVLVLPSKLEEYEFAPYAQDVLDIPRVVAVEPAHGLMAKLMGEVLAVRQARRLRFPGAPRVVVLYDPRQYPLARGLVSQYPEAELWYVRPRAELAVSELPEDGGELIAYDERARERAVQVLAVGDGDPRAANEPLRQRLRELGIISHRAFVPGARIERPR